MAPGRTYEPRDRRVLDWVESLRVRGLSPRTIVHYRTTVIRFETWIGRSPFEVSYRDIQGYLAARVDGTIEGYKPASSTSIRNDGLALRSLYRWAYRFGLVDRDPSLLVDLPRMVRRVVRPAPDEAFAEALGKADAGDKVILALAGFAGLRAV